jgi:putative N6-adenine-specific DNA methylase
MLEKKKPRNFIKIMGKQFIMLDNWKYFIISSHEDFEKFFEKKADKKRKLYQRHDKMQLLSVF